MSKLGRIATVGDVVEAGGGTLTVTRMDGRRIDRICFRPEMVVEAEAPEHASRGNGGAAGARSATRRRTGREAAAGGVA
jgi:Transporter associated domain